MEIIKRLRHLHRQYQTRQQLKKLPIYLFQDIALTEVMIRKQTHKNKIFPFLVFALRYLIKGA
ncbi:hypothetical protein ACLKMH_16620 [Psychromonas sp. KJ10-10]|uniref:hypothetical protein n=1 Tax=Psychromonas sp. KJ10-10 TaxID=3391823 RepID=UPI0039B42323